MIIPEFTTGVSEFGLELAALVRAAPGAKGAVISDAHGDTIDMVRDPEQMSAVDIELCGAQIAQTLFQLSSRLSGHRLEQATFVIEGEHGTLIAAVLLEQTLITLSLDIDASLGHFLPAFDRSLRRVNALLR
jgi:predicted regulator of Ras-like GTPase activity (Roadblock/LC7/MglB family)